MSKETPCIAVCMIDPRSSLCFGCGRTLPEIARWHRMDDAERRAVMARLPARMAEAGLAPISARVTDSKVTAAAKITATKTD